MLLLQEKQIVSWCMCTAMKQFRLHILEIKSLIPSDVNPSKLTSCVNVHILQNSRTKTTNQVRTEFP